jgi:hypothetical protein
MMNEKLQAILDLHKPEEDVWFQTGTICSECSREEYTVKYPCSTIQIIEKE